MASKKPSGRLSIEEKRQRAFSYFTETADFFQLKDLEKLLPKFKGIVMQTVKEVVQSLVDDRLVQCEKIGTSNYYWCFPSSAMVTRKTLIDKLEREVEAQQKAIDTLHPQIAAMAANKTDSAERSEALERLAVLESANKEQLAELGAFSEVDPEKYAQLKAEAQELKEAINRWTDNIFTLQSYCTCEFGVSRSDFCTQFGIPEDLDYVE